MKAFAEMDKPERAEMVHSIACMLKSAVPDDCKFVVVLSADGAGGSCASNMSDRAAVARLLRNVSAGS